jgi:hypothetical protein
MESTTSSTSTSRSNRHRTTSVTTNKWLFVIALSWIPGVNLIFLAYLAFLQKKSHSLRNFSRAAILWIVLLSLILIIMFVYIAPEWTSVIDCIKSSTTRDTPLEQLLMFEELEVISDSIPAL